ncbi:phosphatidate phosphatase LPIN3 isoform X1 [Ahaetulla prasina]|uniref:phosphatidate phosphatase LPIN3 isoform X1 n=1 Tax=Ahaetulla prasina TaxID=499056 RepID=UPI002647F1CD|nr:phosphatidate phosphatase LPIN3 isoform X1 [Ahaetulla prasina]XP_058031756.1 phosphatidate phosphatase LPIN3 isoform X1 [Ahaetulla prasina]XP_058031757.1 phosphatidate phosphatase LPIN3 isoform X1 [Ahaetulla prasina]XP_058031758.1 phosphatidate phosphatase LPIN3 isoform X1 [Ahaetulla prasina]
MNYVGQIAETVFGTVKELYRGLNPATLTGCIDVIVVRQPDGSLRCSPFHVRFGKLRVLHSSEKVVDIEINGEPVNLHMKLGDNGEAFFVQESEEQKERIPSFLCTSPIPTEKSIDAVAKSAKLYGNSDSLGSDTAARKKRRRKKKPKKRESSADSTSEEEGTESERCLEEKRKLLISNNTLYYSFGDVQQQEDGTLQLQEVHPYSDGELAPLQSLSQSCSSAPKSDSELEIRNPELPLGSESQLQWSWGRLPEMSKSDRVEATEPVSNVFATAANDPTTIIPMDETTHFVAITAGSESDLGIADSDDTASSPIIKPTPVFPSGNGLRGDEDACPSICMAIDQVDPDCGLPGDTEVIAANAEDNRSNSIKETDVQTTYPDLEVPSLKKPLSSIEPSSDPEVNQEKRRSSIKKNRHLGPSDIYLDDLSNLDAEQLALYFPKRDAELNWPRAQSDPGIFSHPHVLGGATGDSNADNVPEPIENNPILLSLCGGLGDDGELTHAEKFMKHIVSYQEFAENPAILEDPNLVIQIQKKYYNWAVAAPMILSLQTFQKNLPKNTVDRLMKEKMPKKAGRWWFSWRRKEHEISARKSNKEGKNQDDTSLQRRQNDSSSDEDDVSSHQGDRSIPDAIAQKFLPTYKKSLRLSSDEIKKLNLRDGPNEVVFSVTTQYQGTCRCEANIYLWNWYDKVVISDIDGTITRSDALGHILPHLGKDWTHQGIAKLFHKIHLNGYKFLYCSARAIGMAHITKGYLECVNDQGWMLPKGPILLAPSSLYSAFHREVIEKKPEVFKIACLTDIKNLFGSNSQPFHAAFGNRLTDIYAYKEVALPESRIFTVNPKGELTQELIKITKSTYEHLSEVVEFLFPPIGKDVVASMASPDFSQFSYWKSTLPTVDFEDFV